MSLGASEAAGLSGAAAVLKQIEQRAASLSKAIDCKALPSRWPLAARRLYYDRAFSSIAFLLPLTIECRSAALRLNRLQARWIHAVLHGPWHNRRPVPEGSSRKQYLADLGWDPLWTSAVVAAIALYHKLRAQPLELAHVHAVR